MADDDDDFNPAKTNAAIMRRLARELDAGTLVVVGYSFRDEATVRYKIELAAPAELVMQPSSSPAPSTRDACPKCGSRDKPQDCGRVPGSSPPAVDLMCVRCQHVWQIPEG